MILGLAGGWMAVELLEDLFRGPEMHVPLRRHLYGLPGSRIATRARDPNFREKTAEPSELNPVTLTESLGDLVQDRVQGRFYDMRREMRMGLTKF